ncbi:hypothetical protein RIR_jg24711.t1 [Rhizophagus irregularis DAOM 181602=DAOM 197198]|nr:hypothetical protein RIR_jg24711.t1 [Rhizophagus irregularis DAOM 181602=DAOM 197198]
MILWLFERTVSPWARIILTASTSGSLDTRNFTFDRAERFVLSFGDFIKMNLNYSYKNDRGSNHEITDFEKQWLILRISLDMREFGGWNRVLDHIFSVSKFLKLSFCRFEWTEPSEEIKFEF